MAFFLDFFNLACILVAFGLELIVLGLVLIAFGLVLNALQLELIVLRLVLIAFLAFFFQRTYLFSLRRVFVLDFVVFRLNFGKL